MEKRVTTNYWKPKNHGHDMVKSLRISNNPNMMSQSPGSLIIHISTYVLLWVLIAALLVQFGVPYNCSMLKQKSTSNQRFGGKFYRFLHYKMGPDR